MASHHYLNNLKRLEKLEYFEVSFDKRLGREDPLYYFPLQDNVSFPNSLKKLHLSNCNIGFEEINMKIDSLPFLHRLTLAASCFTGSEWVTVEGKFTSLKYLIIHSCHLERWTTESAHFPCLEQLSLLLLALKQIPSDIGDIPTLKSIELFICSDSLVNSAKQVAEELTMGTWELNLQVEATISKQSEVKKSEYSNFRVEVFDN